MLPNFRVTYIDAGQLQRRFSNLLGQDGVKQFNQQTRRGGNMKRLLSFCFRSFVNMYVGMFMILCLSGFGAFVGITEGYQQAKWWFSDRYAEFTAQFTRVVKVPVRIDPQDESVMDIIKEASKKYNVPKFVILAMIEQESEFLDKRKTNRVLFEQGCYDKLDKRKFEDAEVGRLWCSSLGLMQIIPRWHLHKDAAPECQIEYHELFDARKNIMCGTAEFRRCLNVIGTKGAKAVLTCIKNHNGTGPMADEYTENVKVRMLNLLLEGAL